ncbi:MAG TPA: hypothetical protein VIM53_01430 [Candidatus Saccharimonadales bacterium]
MKNNHNRAPKLVWRGVAAVGALTLAAGMAEGCSSKAGENPGPGGTTASACSKYDFSVVAREATVNDLLGKDQSSRVKTYQQELAVVNQGAEDRGAPNGTQYAVSAVSAYGGKFSKALALTESQTLSSQTAETFDAVHDEPYYFTDNKSADGTTSAGTTVAGVSSPLKAGDAVFTFAATSCGEGA